MLRAVASGALLPEHVLWSLLVQLTAALRVIHAAGLACRYCKFLYYFKIVCDKTAIFSFRANTLYSIIYNLYIYNCGIFHNHV